MVCVVKAVKTPGLVVMVEEEEVMKVAITTFSSSTLTKAASKQENVCGYDNNVSPKKTV